MSLVTRRLDEAKLRAECVARFERLWGRPYDSSLDRSLDSWLATALDTYEKGRALEREAQQIWRRIDRALKAVKTFVGSEIGNTREREARLAEIDRDGGFDATGLVWFSTHTLTTVQDTVALARTRGAPTADVAMMTKPPSRSTFLRDRVRVHLVDDVFSTPPSDLAVLSLLAGFRPARLGKTAAQTIQAEANEIRKALKSLRKMYPPPKTGG